MKLQNITFCEVPLYFFCHNIFHMLLFFNASYSFFGLLLHFLMKNAATEAVT